MEVHEPTRLDTRVLRSGRLGSIILSIDRNHSPALPERPTKSERDVM